MFLRTVEMFHQGWFAVQQRQSLVTTSFKIPDNIINTINLQSYSLCSDFSFFGDLLSVAEDLYAVGRFTSFSATEPARNGHHQ